MSAPSLLPDVPTISAAERLAQLAALEAEESRPAEPEPVAEASGAGAEARCLGERADGTPCTAFRLKGGLFCQWHDPDRRAQEEAERTERAQEQAERTERAQEQAERTERAQEQDAARQVRATAREREVWAAQLQTPEQVRAFVAGVARAAWERRIDPEDARVALEGARLLAELFRASARVDDDHVHVAGERAQRQKGGGDA